jgi:hypothetical protein
MLSNVSSPLSMLRGRSGQVPSRLRRMSSAPIAAVLTTRISLTLGIVV